MLKALARLFRGRIDGNLGNRRLTGLNPSSQTLAKHAYWAEFHRSRKLVAAARAGMSVPRVHEPNRSSAAI